MHRIVICISGGGSLLPPIAEAIDTGQIEARISLVISDRPGMPGLEKARTLGFPAVCVDRAEYCGKSGLVNYTTLSDAVLETVKKAPGGPPDLIVLAGFLSILKGRILEEYAGRIINTHPALLPKHGGKGMYGIRVHRAVLEAGDRESGCTVHYVDAEIDRGPIILQRSVPVFSGDTVENLRERIHGIEGAALAEAIGLALAHVRSNGGKQ